MQLSTLPCTQQDSSQAGIIIDMIGLLYRYIPVTARSVQSDVHSGWY